MKSMSGEDFERWIVATATASDTSFVSKLEIHDEATLDLLVSERNLPGVAANLNKLVRINDAPAARCRFDSRTNIDVAETGFPAYLLRLDPVVHGSIVRIAINVPEASESRDIPQSFLALSDAVQRRRQLKALAESKPQLPVVDWAPGAPANTEASRRPGLQGKRFLLRIADRERVHTWSRWENRPSGCPEKSNLKLGGSFSI
jgi:hypothetical protein